MGRCILHVGMHKTATSSIQQSLHGFSDARFIYADIDGHANHSRAIFEALGLESSPHAARAAPRAARHGRQEQLAALEASIAAAAGRTYLISGEGISLAAAPDLRRLQEFLMRFFDSVLLAAAVRAPAAYMTSAFQEPLKRGTRDDPAIFLRHRSYRKTFRKFINVFGASQMRLWKFEPRNFPEGCAVRDFCRRLDIDLPPQRIVRVNESLSREALGLLFIYRRCGRALGSMELSAADNRRLVAELSRIGDSRFRFAPQALKPVLEANQDDIAWMEGELGESLHEDLGEPRPDDVSGEDDLLRPQAHAVEALRERLGRHAPAGVKGGNAEEVARLVHALRSPANLRLAGTA